MWIIVKNAEYPREAGGISDTEKVCRHLAYDGYSCVLAEISGGVLYKTQEEARVDCLKLIGVNPNMGFGVRETCD